MTKPKILGVLGGLGPMASVYFYELITSLTRADCDQAHISLLLSSFAHTPDRTAYILNAAAPDPVPDMVDAARRLEAAGAQLLTMPCNTAHYFYDAVARSVGIPMLNIIDETLHLLATRGAKRVGLLATEGTVRAGTYPLHAKKFGIVCVMPDNEEQKALSDIIYGQIKSGREPDFEQFLQVADSLSAKGCDHLVLGCTELSLFCRSHALDDRFVDSLYALARAAVLACGKKLNA